jgi:hypothetical protein
MPSSQTILDQLKLVSNSAVSVALGWHVALALAVAALILGWRPSQRAAGVMLATPVISAAAVALTFGNPFNGVILGALGCALVLIALRLPVARVARGGSAAAAVGILMIGFGSWYPHFVEGGTPLAYLYAAPTGLIPCPTLSLVIGFALLGGGLRSRAWSITLAAVGLFYGLFGVVRLGVSLDIPLILGAAALLTVPRLADSALISAPAVGERPSGPRCSRPDG